jgi:putative ABC transport system permease protein
MLKSHIKIAWRNLKSNRLYSGINILGLSISFTVVVLLFMFIKFERNFDSIHKNKDNTYRVLLHTDGDAGSETWANVPAIVAPTVKQEILGILESARILKHNFGDTASIKVNNSNYTESSLFWGDNELFNIFNIEFIKGQFLNPLEKPNTVVLSESTAKKYFRDDNPIGKTITVDNYNKLEVTAVYKDFPKNSTLDCEIIASFSSTYFSKSKEWSNASFETYCLFDKNIDIQKANSQLAVILNKNVPKNDQWFSLSFQPFSEVHLNSADISDSYASRIGDIKEVRNLSLLAILILVIACINYVNLVTASSQKRNIDVGINKTLGATSKNMILRFFTETAIIVAISLAIGLVLAVLSLPIFNKFVEQNLDISILYNFKFILGFIIIFIATTVLSGLYPAIYLSIFSPKSIFNPSTNQSKITTYIRKGLVVFQFTASVVLIISSLVIYKQLNFIQNKNLGFNPEGVVAISITAIQKNEKVETLMNEFKQLNTVTSVAGVQGYPGKSVSGRSLAKDENYTEVINIQTNVVDKTINDVLNLNVLSGRMPNKKVKSDIIVEVVLNKKGIDYLGYSPEEAIGKKIYSQLGNNSYIVGVVDNFNFASLKVPIGAYAFHNNPYNEQKYFLLVRYNTENLSQLMSTLEKTFYNVIPDVAFDFTFLDKTVQHFYHQEYKTARIIIFFCGLAIFLGCLGLFALAAYMTEQRSKEIGIRKVLGASVYNLWKMLSKDFILLVIMSCLIAIPITYHFMGIWLENYEYHVDISWWIFGLAIAGALLITLLTVSFQAIKVARANPIKSLRTE